MLFNYYGIRRYVEWAGSVEEICDLLTGLGLEVESVQTPQGHGPALTVGKILTKESHPNADRLTVCTVDVGDNEPRTIVCGAQNHFAGAKVVVALPGRMLPGDFEIVPRKVRGIESAGMMSSRSELGLGDDHEGIILLPDDIPVGAVADEFLTTIELNVTPNRPDCLGWVGIAREIAAATSKPLKPPVVDLPASDSEQLPIVLDDPSGCARYVGRIIRGVKVGPSPQWLQHELKSVGLNPINNVVDITNFVLLETGQPLHAFDLSLLAGPEIHTRRARKGEEITALNGITYKLSGSELLISDAEKGVAIAGVMGGENSEVSDQTTDLLLESAWFEPSSIRRTAKQLGISTDASFRFERGVDPEIQLSAINRCSQLILDICGGALASPAIEAISAENVPQPAEIHLRPERANIRIGARLTATQQTDLLERLGCRILSQNHDMVHVVVPSYRPDLLREIDLIEELARHYGYDQIPSTPPGLSGHPGQTNPYYSMEQTILSLLVARGWLEIKSFSFVHPEYATLLNLPEANALTNSVQVENPINRETSCLRTTLIPNMLENLQRNAKRGATSLRFFEFGKVYLKELKDILNCERHALCIGFFGQKPSHWSCPDVDFDFFDAKGVVEALCQELGIGKLRFEKAETDFLHPGQSARCYCEETPIGVLGALHPEVCNRFDFPVSPILVELDLDAVFSLGRLTTLQLAAPSPYPSIRRDLSLTVALDLAARDIIELIENSNTPYLEKVALYDRFTGKQVGDNKQSLGFHLTYRSSEKTLTDEEINTIHQALLKDLNSKLGAIQRGMEVV